MDKATLVKKDDLRIQDETSEERKKAEQKGKADKEDGITCLALISAVTVWTVTRVTVDLVFTGPSVLTRTTGTLVDVCGDKYYTVSLKVYDYFYFYLKTCVSM